MTADLLDVWGKIKRPSGGQLQGRLALGSSSVWLALDSDGRRHILVDAPGVAAGRSLGTTKGLTAVTAELDVAGRPTTAYVDVSCLDATFNDMFATVAGDLISAVAAGPHDPIGAVTRTLETWRWFWGTTSGLTGEEATGLFGELWFLLHWTPWPSALHNWIGPSGAIHDFAWPEVSVEVKTTRVRADGQAIHRIANLDQLTDPNRGQLYLFSLQLMPDVLAANTLPSLVRRTRDSVRADPALSVVLLEKLAAARYNPAHDDRYREAYRVIAEEIYKVTAGFPKLTRATIPGGLPQGVDNVSYTLDLAACRNYLVADSQHRSGSEAPRYPTSYQ